MPDYSPMSEERRPTVRILAFQPEQHHLQCVLWGLEEEGIPAEVAPASRESAVGLGKQGAQMSPLNVGIGVNGVEGLVVLHHRDLPPGQPLFRLPTREVSPMELRRLGANAARLVKGEPLIFHDEPDKQPAKVGREPQEVPVPDSRQLADLVNRIVAELTAKR